MAGLPRLDSLAITIANAGDTVPASTADPSRMAEGFSLLWSQCMFDIVVHAGHPRGLAETANWHCFVAKMN